MNSFIFLAVTTYSDFISKILNLLKFIGFNESIFNMENLIVGCKINDEAYYEINFLLTVIFFLSTNHITSLTQREQK